MELEQAINYALDGNALLFLGSGFSTGAVKASGDNFASAGPLAKKLCAECGIPEEEQISDLGQASEIFQSLKSESELVDYLIKEYTAVNVNSAQEIIGSVNWKRIYTTNYDNVVEMAYSKNKKIITPVVLSQKPSDFKDKTNLCVHLNGRVDGLTINKLNNEFKLTNISYLTEEFRKSEWLSLFRTDLLTANAIFFIGYSMQYDLDIKRVVSSLAGLKDKTFFIMWEKEPRVNQLLVEHFGKACPIGTDVFASMIKETRKTFVPSAGRLSPYLCFKKHNFPKTPSSIVDSDVLKFLTQGEYASDKVYYSTISFDDYKYCIHRTKLKSLVGSIENGEKNCLIHSSLGNGKTIFTDALSSMLTQKGYHVYRYYRYMATYPTEVERICSETDKIALIFEDYSGCIENLKILKQHRSDQVLIVTERSYVNEANYDTISNLFGDFNSVDINKLDGQETESLNSLLEHFGFWSYLSSKSKNRRIEFIDKTCKGYLRNVVLQLLQSPDIAKRFKDIVDTVKQKNGYYEAIIFLLVASVSQVKLGLDDLSEALDVTQLNSPRFKNDPIVKEFVDFDDNVILPKSSLLSKSLLAQIFDSEIIVDTLIKIMQHLNDYGTGKVARQITRRLMTFTNVQQILNEQDPHHKYNMLRYYESIKSMPSCSKNPHFWLQYAIVMLSERNYSQAKLYFDAAYSFGQMIDGFDTYQIDNHYARYILENERISGTPDKCMEAFRHAHGILMDPKHKVEVRYYPYKVARLYYPFYEKFFKQLKNFEQQEFINSCSEMLKRLEWYESTSETGGKRKDVILAKEQIQAILNEMPN
ncbi:MAG: SIR2 family protein [Bacteroidales bacterium]|nr:SIR2 family protein [Bacteroidales bacterium]